MDGGGTQVQRELSVFFQCLAAETPPPFGWKCAAEDVVRQRLFGLV